jgi:hypothetical protein
MIDITSRFKKLQQRLSYATTSVATRCPLPCPIQSTWKAQSAMMRDPSHLCHPGWDEQSPLLGAQQHRRAGLRTHQMHDWGEAPGVEPKHKMQPTRFLWLVPSFLLAACSPDVSEPTTPRHQVQQSLMYSGHDYLFIRSAQNWWEAKASCEALGYGLVTINDANEEAWLHSFEESHQWWIGYTDQQSEGLWRWSHGSSSYTNWAPGQPDDSGHLQDCAYDNWSGNRSRWDDGSCDSKMYFICESLQ